MEALNKKEDPGQLILAREVLPGSIHKEVMGKKVSIWARKTANLLELIELNGFPPKQGEGIALSLIIDSSKSKDPAGELELAIENAALEYFTRRREI